MPPIFVITDRAVEDGRHICNVLEGQLKNKGPICPRICTFGMGIGLVKNSMFLISQSRSDSIPYEFSIQFFFFFM